MRCSRCDKKATHRYRLENVLYFLCSYHTSALVFQGKAKSLFKQLPYVRKRVNVQAST